MAVIESRHQLDRLAEQHSVAKHVARHVADAGDRDRIVLDVHAHFKEVALDGNPRASGGNPHLLVIVTVRSAAREGVAEPEILLLSDRVGGVGETRGTLVRGDYEIGIVAIADNDLRGVHDLVVDDIVRHRKQGADEDLVAVLAFGQPRIALVGRRKHLCIKAALGSRRHDDRVLDQLSLHQPENLGPEIVPPVRPAKASASDRAAAKVDSFDPRRIDPDLAPRDRRRKTGDQAGIHFERKRLSGGRRKCVGPEDRIDERAKPPENPVVVDRSDRGERVFELGLASFDRGLAVLDRRIVGRPEQADQRAAGLGMPAKGVGDRKQTEGASSLAKIAEPGPDPDHCRRLHVGEQDELVELVVFGGPAENAGDGFLDLGRPRQDRVEVGDSGKLDPEVADITKRGIGKRRRDFLDDPEPEILEHRHRVGERNQPALAVGLELELAGRSGRSPGQANAALAIRGEVAEPHDVGRGLLGAGSGAIAVRERRDIDEREPGGARCAGRRDQLGLDRGTPALDHFDERRVEGVAVREIGGRIDLESEAEERQFALAEFDRPAADRCFDFLFEHRPDRFAAGGALLIAGKPDESIEMPAERSRKQEKLGPWTVGEAHRGKGGCPYLILVEGNEQVVRKRGNDVRERLSGVARRSEAKLLVQLQEPLAEHRDVLGRSPQRFTGPKARVNRQRVIGQPDHDDVERDPAVDGRNPIRFQDEHRMAFDSEIIDRGFGRAFLPKRRLVLENSERVLELAAGADMGMAEKREIVVGEEAEKFGAFVIALVEAVGIRLHLGEHRRPVGDGGANVGEHALQLANQFLPAAGIGPVELDVDDRFRLAFAKLLDLALFVAGDFDDRMEKPVDGEVVCGNRSGNAVDEERHVLVDGDQPHPAPAGFASCRFDPDRRCPGRADRRHGGNELRRLLLLLGLETLGFAGESIRGDRSTNEIDQRLRQARLGRHFGNCSGRIVGSRRPIAPA